MTTKYFETKEQYIAFRNAWKKAATEHTHHLTAAHFLLYNIVRGKDPYHGFTPFQRLSKIEGMGMFNLGAYQAWQELKYMREANTGYWKDRAERFVAPFGDTFTIEDLKNITIPKIEPLYSNFGKGLRAFEKLEAGNVPRTIDGILALAEEEAA